MSVKQYVAGFTGYPAESIRGNESCPLTTESNRKP